MISLDKQPKEYILPGIITLLSLINLFSSIYYLNIIQILVALIGLTGVVLFLYKKGNPALFFQVWIFSQIPVIHTESIILIENGIQAINSTPIFDATQLLQLTFGFTLGLKGGTNLFIYFNFVPLLYFGLYRVVAASILVGKKIKLTKIKKESKYKNSFPITGSIIKRVELEKENDWLMVELENELIVGEIKSTKILIHPKNKEKYNKRSDVVSFIRLIKNEQINDAVMHKKEDYPFYDWLNIQIIK
ncbi:MAG: hypothetical protein NT150_00640 [Bacteroidetes bacterium]|nr:hypothetical protein [Bacteroidota bacterium]